MKIKLRLISVMLFLILFPIIIINLIINNDVIDYNTQTFLSGVEGLAKTQAENLNFYFESIITESREVATRDVVKDYVKLINDSYDFEEMDDTVRANLLKQSYGYDNVTEALTNIQSYNADIEMVMLVNMEGVIVASTDDSTLGWNDARFEVNSSIPATYNGISEMQEKTENGVGVVVFSVVKNIYSSDNVKQGYLLIQYNSQYISRIINSTRYDKSVEFIVLDHSGGYVDKYEYLKNYNETAEFMDAIPNLNRINSTNRDESQSQSFEYTYKSYKMSMYNANVANCNWAVVVIINLDDVTSKIETGFSAVGTVSIVLSVFFTILTILFVIWFTKPVDNIAEVLMKKRRGDNTARFRISTSDEFGQISQAFNTMFDDVMESEQRYRTIVEMTDNIVFEINLKKNSVFVSNNFNQKFSFRPRSDTLQDSFFYKGRIHKDDKERYLADFDRVLSTINYFQGEYRFKNVYGDFSWILIRATKFFGRDETPSKIIGVIVDIDREKKSEMHLLQRASFDALTQLYNRETFIKTLANEIDVAKMRKTLDAVLFIDLDDFKHFNDEFGHACGDDVLKFVADVLKEIVFEKGFAGRFGGDEYVVCLSNMKYLGAPGDIAKEIIDALDKGFVSESCDLHMNIHCSIGIAFFGENGKTCEDIIAAADEAMYTIKKHGKSNFAYAKTGGIVNSEE